MTTFVATATAEFETSNNGSNRHLFSVGVIGAPGDQGVGDQQQQLAAGLSSSSPPMNVEADSAQRVWLAAPPVAAPPVAAQPLAGVFDGQAPVGPADFAVDKCWPIGGGPEAAPCYVPFLPPWSQVVCYQPPSAAAACYYYPSLVASAGATIVNGNDPSATPSPLLEAGSSGSYRELPSAGESLSPSSSCYAAPSLQGDQSAFVKGQCENGHDQVSPTSGVSVEQDWNGLSAQQARSNNGDALGPLGDNQRNDELDGVDESADVATNKSGVEGEWAPNGNASSAPSTAGHYYNEGSPTAGLSNASVGAQVFHAGTYQSSMAAMTPVYVHVNMGQTLSLRVGDKIQYIPGPATVRMVSEQNPPTPLSMNVPPGHIVQQIVDENGTLRHVILSAQTPAPSPHPPPPPPPPPPPSMTNAPFAAGVRGAAGGQQQYIAGCFRFDGGGAQPSPQPPPPPPPMYYPATELYPARQNGPYRFCQPGKFRMAHRYDRRRGGGGHHHHHLQQHGQQVLVPGEYAMTGQQQPSTSNAPVEEVIVCQVDPPQVEQVGIREALVRWRPVDCAALEPSDFTYEVTLLSGQGESGKVINSYKCAGNQEQQWLFGLKPGTDYAVRLRASTDERHVQGKTTQPVPFRTKSTVPDRPAPPRLAQRMRTSLLLRWSAPNDNGSKIVAYHLEMQSPPAKDEAGEEEAGDHQQEASGRRPLGFVEIYSGPLLQFKVKKLQLSTGYKFRLCAENACGRGDFGDLFTAYTSGAPPCKPDQAPRLLESTCNSLTVGWQRSEDADEYQLFMDDPQSGYGFLPVAVTADCQFTVDNLQRCHEYHFRLLATNEDGHSAMSDVASYSTSAGRPSRPARPTLLAGKATATRTTLQWSPPHDTGGCPIDEYCVQLQEEGVGGQQQPPWRSIYTGGQREFQFEDGRLRPGAIYNCRLLCSSKAGGQSEPGHVLTFTVMAVAPGPPKGLQIVGKVKSTGCVVRWDEPEEQGGCKVTDYQLELLTVKEEGEEEEQPTLVYHGPKREMGVQPLAAGRWYEVRARAANSAGFGPWCQAVRFKTSASCPECPRNLRCAQSTSTSLLLVWEPPSTDRGSPVTEYRLSRAMQRRRRSSQSSSVSSSGGSASRALAQGEMAAQSTPPSPPCSGGRWLAFEKIYSGPGLSYEVRQLTADCEYAFHVQAVNQVAPSQPSAQLICRTMPGPPGCPQDVVGEPLSLWQVQLAWTPPLDNGAPILGYAVDVSPPPDGGVVSSPVLFDVDEQGAMTTSSRPCAYTLNDLQPESAYRIRVRARNRCGWGAYSNAVRVHTLAPPPRPPVLELAAVGHNFVKLKWCGPASEEGRQYVVEVENRAGFFSPVYEGVAKACKVGRLNEWTVYKFRIRVLCKSAGAGPWSELCQFRTGRTPPGPIKAAVRVTDVAETWASLEWAPVKMTTAPGESLVYAVDLREAHTRLARQADDLKVVQNRRVAQPACTFANLQPGVTYSVRVCAVRLCPSSEDEPSDECNAAVEVVGPSSTALFTTSVPSSSKHRHAAEGGGGAAGVASSLLESTQQTARGYRGLTDHQFAWVILIGFTMVAAIIAYVIEKVIVGS